MAPSVSVILAVYNGERHLQDSLNSVLAQTFTDFELIVVDDGSTDRTMEILAAVERADPRIVVVRQENRGLTASLIRGVGLARGTYVARQDADDISKPERFERQVAHLDAHPAVAALGTSADVIDRSGTVVGALTTAYGAQAVKYGLVTSRTSPVHGSIMMRRDAHEMGGGYREAFRACQDYDLWLRLSARFEIDNLADPLYQWRLDSESVYTSQRETQLKYHGIALGFHHEREADGYDSCALLESCHGNLEEFAARYQRGAFVYAAWGELLLRGLGNSGSVRQYFRRALLGGYVRPRTIGLSAWTHLGLPWPGGRPLALATRVKRP